MRKRLVLFKIYEDYNNLEIDLGDIRDSLAMPTKMKNRSKLDRLSLAALLLAGVAQAKIDWNLESTFLMHLQQKAESD
jgi:hypothetical protein